MRNRLAVFAILMLACKAPDRNRTATAPADAPTAARVDAVPATPDTPRDAAPPDSSPPDASPADKALIERTLAIPAADLLRPAKPVRRPEVPLKGSIREYVTSVVHTNGVGKITRTSVLACPSNAAHKCVEIVGEACPPDLPGDGDCEGMYLTVVVDVSSTKPTLERAASGETPVRDQADIEALLQEAP